MRRWLLILIPAFLLIGIVVLTRAIASGRYVIAGNPGDLLYAAAFDGFLDEWQQYADGQLAAEVEDGVMRLSITEADRTPFSLSSPRFSDFDLTVEARAVAGPLNNGYGVIYRAEQPERRASATWGGLLRGALDDLLLGAEGSTVYDMFLVSSDGYYSLWRSVEGRQQAVSTWIPSEAVRQGLGETNTLRVLADDGLLRFFINDEPVPMCIPDDPAAQSTVHPLTGECMEGQMLEAIPDAFPYGRVGVVAQSFDEPGVVVEFDNLVIFAPGAE